MIDDIMLRYDKNFICGYGGIGSFEIERRRGRMKRDRKGAAVEIL